LLLLSLFVVVARPCIIGVVVPPNERLLTCTQHSYPDCLSLTNHNARCMVMCEARCGQACGDFPELSCDWLTLGNECYVQVSCSRSFRGTLNLTKQGGKGSYADAVDHKRSYMHASTKI
jgi:hypothetical protein